MVLAATFTGLRIALLLQDERGVWYRDASGLSPGQMMALENHLEDGRMPPFTIVPGQDPEFQVIEMFPLTGDPPRPLGVLCACVPDSDAHPPNVREGLARVARSIESLLQDGRRNQEWRAPGRSPSAASFVPGLVHELGSFIFGISANLDAFEARFSSLEDVRRYALAIRGSLDRMAAFIEELREYGESPQVTWTGFNFVPLLQGVVDEHRAAAAQRKIELELSIGGTLPTVMADASSLRGAFGRLVGFMVQHARPGSAVHLRVETRSEGHRTLLWGYLEGCSLPSRDSDLSRLFEPFYFRTSGLGRLALPVARRILESHGGSLHATPAPSGGIRIHFVLPTLQGPPWAPGA